MSLRGVTCAAVVLSVVAASAADVPLRIVTFNTYNGIADEPDDREACGNLLTSLDLDGPGPNTSLMPDIVCLQETTSLSDLESFRDDYLPGYQVIKGPTTDGFYSNGYFFRGDLVQLRFDEFGTPGPRRLLRLVLDVPATLEHLVIYNDHFKAGQDPGDQEIRSQEANAVANRIAADREYGIDLDGDHVPDYLPRYYLLGGDLNQDDFGGTIIDALLEGGSNGLPTALNDVRVETLYGAQIGGFLGDTWSTRGTLYRRYDYVLASDEVFAHFDTNEDETVDQDELNEAGFVYISTDDGGLQASGQLNATAVASDHAPVIVDFVMPGIPGDFDGDGTVDLSDLGVLLASYGIDDGGDLNGDGVTDLADLGILLANYGLSG